MMDHIPISGIEELQTHLQQIIQHPQTTLNAKLFDEVELQLNGEFKFTEQTAKEDT